MSPQSLIPTRMSMPADVRSEATRPRSLFVASTGGHLAQLFRLSGRLQVQGEPLWVTFDSPQSRSLLHGMDREFVRSIAPRDWLNTARNFSAAREILDRHNAVELFSTGSAIALSFIPVAQLRGIRCNYIESAARSRGPSLTGRALAALPGTSLYTQYSSWANERWRLGPSVFDGYVPSEAETPSRERPLSVLVALGTLGFRFDRLVERVAAAADPNWHMVWQTGPNAYRDLPGEQHGTLTSAEFEEACRRADVVISHAGVGSALAALDAGRRPLVVPRDSSLGEHVDGHQAMIASELAVRNLALTIEPLDIDRQAIRDAARWRVEHTAHLGTPYQQC